MSVRPSVQGAYDQIDKHEKVCAERYRRIDEKLAALNEGHKSMTRAAWGLLIAICGWLALQVYGNLADKPGLAPSAQAAAINPPER